MTAFGEMLSPNRMRLVFSVERGEPTRISEIHFAGNVNFAADELTEALRSCLGEKWGVYDLRHIDYCAQKDLRRFMYSKGYFAARMGKPEQRQVRGAIEITFQISEGPRFRLGEVRIVGANALSEDQIVEQLGQTTGDIADGRNLQDLVYERLQRLYADKGHMLYNAEFEPDMIPPADEGLDGTVNVRISIDEGPLMRISKIEILGVDKETESTLLRGFLQKIGTPFSQTKFEEDIRKLNETERFDPVDKYDQNVELAVYEESKDVVIRIRLRPRSE